MTKQTKMDAHRFTELVNAYGADPARWPEAERDDAYTFAQANPGRAEAILSDAKDLDRLLDTGRHEVGSTEFLAARILNAAGANPNSAPAATGGAANDHVTGRVVRRQGAWKAVAATFLVTTGFGFAAGQTAAANSAQIREAETLLSLTLDNAYDGQGIWEDEQ